MRRRVESALVAKVGATVFAVALGVPLVPASGAQVSEVIAAGVVETADAGAFPFAFDPGTLEVAALAAVAPAVPVAVAPAVPVATPAPPPTPEPPLADGTVLASWYGPGFYGGRTACGHAYTPEIMGVAHPTLACGTLIRISSPAGVTVVVPVIDRGPFVSGRTLDLSSATKLALRCADLCWVRIHVGT